MRARGPERGREPTDQKRQIGGLDVHVFAQERRSSRPRRFRQRELAGRSPEMNVGLFDDLPAVGVDRDCTPRGIAQVQKKGRSCVVASYPDKIGFGRTRNVGVCGQCGLSPTAMPPMADARLTRSNAASASARLPPIPTHDTLDGH